VATNFRNDDGHRNELYANVQIARPELKEQRYKGLLLLETDESLLEKLPLIYQEVLRSKGSYEEMAMVLHVPVGTIRSRLHRARAALVELRAINLLRFQQNFSGSLDKPFSN
jgi:DNA-directed RNA polymerase specialized sigma24 family protein